MRNVLKPTLPVVAIPTLGITLVDDQPTQNPAFAPATFEKLYLEYATPSEEHEYLACLTGKWKTITRNFSRNPEEPAVRKGTATFEMIMAGQ